MEKKYEDNGTKIAKVSVVEVHDALDFRWAEKKQPAIKREEKRSSVIASTKKKYLLNVFAESNP